MTTAPKPPLGRDANSNGEGSFWRLTNALFSLHGLTSSTERNIQRGLVVFGEPARARFFLYSNEVAFLPAENLLPQPFPKFHFAAFSAGLERFYRFFKRGGILEQKEANHCKAATIFLHQVELFSGLSSLPSPNYFCCCVIAIDSPQMFVTSLVMHWTFLVPLHWSFYLVNSSETQIPKADIFFQCL